MKLFLLAFTLCFSLLTSAQSENENHFLVEFEKFSPPIQDLIMSFDGRIAEPFLANDIDGKEHFLGDYKGKNVILWFWSLENQKAKDQIASMTLLQQRHTDLKVIAFVKESRAKVQEFVKQSPIDLVIIPNGEIFGEMAYGADLGSPRMFLIDEFGIIKNTLPESAFIYNDKLVINLESLLGGM